MPQERECVQSTVEHGGAPVEACMHLPSSTVLPCDSDWHDVEDEWLAAS